MFCLINEITDSSVCRRPQGQQEQQMISGVGFLRKIRLDVVWAAKSFMFRDVK